jgi:glycerol uptake facilitator-like aquaporin
MAKLRPLLAEFIGTFALIFVGIGAIKTAGHDIVAVALAHGLTIAAFVSATLHISGGQLNPAVTFGLLCGGHMRWSSAFRYWIAQLLGGIAAALICLGLFGRDVVVTGTPQLAINLTAAQGILVEGVLSCIRGPRHGSGYTCARSGGVCHWGDHHPRHLVRRPSHRGGDESRASIWPSGGSQFLA